MISHLLWKHRKVKSTKKKNNKSMKGENKINSEFVSIPSIGKQGTDVLEMYIS